MEERVPHIVKMIKHRLAAFRLRRMFALQSIRGYQLQRGFTETEKELMEKWAEGLRTGVAEALGIPKEEVIEIPQAWKERWMTEWKKAFVKPEYRTPEAAKSSGAELGRLVAS